MPVLTRDGFKKTAYNFAVSYASVLFFQYVVKKLETPYLDLIHAEQAAQASLREKSQSEIKISYHFCVENVLSIPVVRIIVFYALSFFSSRKEVMLSSKKELDNLWSEKKIDLLLTKLDAEMDSPQGITWAPTTHLREAPFLPRPLVALSRFARDLTLEIASGQQVPFSGRKNELDEIAEILARNQKSNPILLGRPGVGKTAFARGIATLIVRDEASLPPFFKGKRVFLLEWDRLVMGIEKYTKDTPEKRLMQVISEACMNKEHVLIFIDEIHAFLKDNKDIMAILKPALADGTLSCIAATTTWDYEKMLEADPSLERRFPQVHIFEPSDAELLHVLKAFVLRLEAHHGVHISDKAVEECINLGKRFLQGESFPDKAIDLLDQAACRLSIKQEFSVKEKQLSVFLKLLIHMRNQVNDSVELDQKINEIRGKFSRVVTEELIRELVAQKVGLPLQKLQESQRELLNNLEARLSEKIIGQKKSIRSLCQAVRRGRIKIGNESRPTGVFLMLGPTGVGKTASVLALSEVLYGSKDNMLRLDMSEYSSSADITKLIGAPPGYKGHGAGGKLTNWLKKKPFSIVLFDEVEKADSSVFDLLLQVFDAGRLTDGNNETVQCVDTIFIMTSNIGAQLILENHKKLKEGQFNGILEELMNEIFRPEFINRFQEVMLFEPLSEQEISQVTALQCQELQRRVERNLSCPNLKMTWDPSVVQFLVNIGYNPAMGAREISRHITRLMENQISDLIVQCKINPGNQIHFKSDGKSIELSIKELPSSSL